ncbi:hypothetical protein COX03_01760 [Candidatus Woesebacteria bacterium CG22_combo_CG10-13_8_21_14_all_39_10]|uniref:SpoVT-AbrB domain-containing protein n=3 Tax=Candidatus Woeseibacteriota TaxID=1752722 RepID=A0A2M7AQN5_9BACT|nr:MAG: hypothetical protein COX03_01760 [Candidatus Woesebacteria bacterium CG22_combo_CG10-13_8_21_14_all_39_10]PIU71946.1 MAG: hypothetical protein COS80_00455 [Candidatus Woesebacteria bacterium CG06_land_8_20_14_3_00_39_27]PIZ46220.1 MAG: hypothetical protein COY30_00540 [Candidatus Woesebacteria bacterium CG_4_10_14_0_2_um_filter_44_9]
MQVITSVTQKGQVTIPKSIRDIVGITLNGRVRVTADEDRVILVPQKSFLDMIPLINAPAGKDALKARDYMAKHYERV